MQAYKEHNKLEIVVDSDQAMLYKDSDPVLANLIASSMLKRVDQSILLAVKAAKEGTLAWGTRVALGINEGCVGLADNEIFQKVVPEDVRKTIGDYTAKIQGGEIKVDTAFGMDQGALKAYIDSVRP